MITQVLLLQVFGAVSCSWCPSFLFQVVCIRSTWNALSPKLSHDTRPLILKTLSELFSLVPSLTVNSKEYEVCVIALGNTSSSAVFQKGCLCLIEQRAAFLLLLCHHFNFSLPIIYQGSQCRDSLRLVDSFKV